jgi:hypothetical protein
MILAEKGNVVGQQREHGEESTATVAQQNARRAIWNEKSTKHWYHAHVRHSWKPETRGHHFESDGESPLQRTCLDEMKDRDNRN